MFFVDARTREVDDSDVVARLTSRTEAMAEHEPEGGLEHCFVGLLKASLLVKGVAITQALTAAGSQAFLHHDGAGLGAGTLFLCYSREAR